MNKIPYKNKKIDPLFRRPIDFKKCLTATISIFLKGVWDYKSFFNSSSNKEKSFFILVIEL